MRSSSTRSKKYCSLVPGKFISGATSDGLVSTSVGPSTIKRRMVTVQHPKAGRFAIDEEDYLITLKLENGGMFLLKNPTVGFKKEKPDVNIPLPKIDNLSDHYPVSATLSEMNFLAKF